MQDAVKTQLVQRLAWGQAYRGDEHYADVIQDDDRAVDAFSLAVCGA